MSLMHFRYYTPLTEFDRLFDGALAMRFRPSVFTDTQYGASVQGVESDVGLFRPRMDVHESEDANVVTATFELPGMTADDITLDVHQHSLTIASETRKSDTREEGGYAVRERRYGKFSRTLQLPFGTKSDDVKAKMENGVLTVTFPKTAPEQQVQRITVQ